MMSNYIDEVFGPTGILASSFRGYVPRPDQIKMASAVDTAITKGKHLLVEAPTGVGKSLAYSIPATYHATHHGKRVVIATANIALQEQLVEKDLPLLAEILPWTFRFSLLKGKSNYLCLDSMSKERSNGTSYLLTDPEDQIMLNDILKWTCHTKTGDVSELPFEPPKRLWRSFSTSSDDCQGVDCEFHDRCFAARAREKAAAADVVVVNYHLLFAHLQVLVATGKDLVLPSFDIAILDEAHKAAEIARDFFGVRVTAGSVRWAARQLVSIGQADLRDDLIDEAQFFFDRLESHYHSPLYESRLKKPNAVPWSGLGELLGKASNAYASAQIDQPKEIRDELCRAADRCDQLRNRLRKLMTLSDPKCVVYMEPMSRGGVALRSKLISVAELLGDTLFKSVDCAVLTSATMTSNGKFDHLISEVGIPEPEKVIVDSPFDFRGQAALIIPNKMPKPAEDGYREAVAEAVAEVIELARGRTLGLFTSYKNLNLAYERIKGSGYRVLRQGDRPRNDLVEEFRRDVDSVLLGTDSFWTGIDVPGESLSCVIIDRLPFPSPTDPVLDAIRGWNTSCFSNHIIPRAVIQFKQGFGRLIRSSTDCGVVVVLDRRLLSMSYGNVFINSLPKMRWSEQIEIVRQFFDEAA